MLNNPVVQEARSIYGGAYEFRRLYVLTAAIAAIAVFVLWPAERFTAFVSSDEQPVVFDVAVTLFSLALGLLSGMVGLNNVATRSFITEIEWIERTPLSRGNLINGKIAAALFHTLFIALLIAPFLVIAAIPSGVSRLQPLYALLLLASFMALCRAAALALLSIFSRRHYLATGIFWIIYLVLAFLTINRAPILHPAVAVLGTPGEPGPWYAALPEWFAPWHTAAIHSGIAAMFLLLYSCGILLVERRTRHYAT